MPRSFSNASPVPQERSLTPLGYQDMCEPTRRICHLIVGCLYRRDRGFGDAFRVQRHCHLRTRPWPYGPCIPISAVRLSLPLLALPVQPLFLLRAHPAHPDAKRHARAHAFLRLDVDRSAEQPHELARDVQPEPRPAVVARDALVELPEALEQRHDLARVHAHARVHDGRAQAQRAGLAWLRFRRLDDNGDRLPGWRELRRDG